MTTAQSSQMEGPNGSGAGARMCDLPASLVANACAAVNGQLDAFVKRLIDALLAYSEEATDPKLVSGSFNIANVLKKNSYAFYYLASIQFKKAFETAMRDLQGASGERELSIDGELSLVPFEVMERRLTLTKLARPFESAHADALSGLRKRLSCMLQREEIAQSDNPFRPELLLEAMDASWREFAPDEKLHDIALPLFTAEVFLDLTAIYTSLNEELIRNDVLPDINGVYSIKKSNTAQEATKAEAKDAVTLDQLRRLFGVPAMGATSQAAASTGFPAIPDIPGIAPIQSGYGNLAGGPTSAMAMPGLNGMAMDGQMPAFPTLNGGNISNGVPAMGNVAHAQQAWQMAAVNQQLLGYLATLQRLPQMHAARGDHAGGSATSAAHASGATTSAHASHAPVDTSILSQIKQQAPSGSLTQVDERTIDLMTRIFDVVFNDRNIPAEMKALIGVLQVPVLKAALVDKEFFFQEDHPARRLIDVLGKASVGWDAKRGKEDPIYQAVQRNVKRIQDEFESETAVFSEVLRDIEHVVEHEEQQSSAQLEQPISQAMRQERIYIATKAAKHEIAIRVQSGEVVAFVETFLQNKWVRVLTLAYSVKEDKPAAYESALQTMDDLIWSVKPKITPEERKQLIAKLPTMLATLNKWLDIVKLDDAERMQFFAELAECHASIVRAPLEMSPERRLEISMKVAQEAAERRKQKLEEAQVEASKTSEELQVLDQLERGVWMEFTERPEESSRVKLAWISPMRSLFIFSTCDRKESFSLSAEELAQCMSKGEASVLRIDGLVNRALAYAVQDLSANDPSLDMADAA